MRVHVFFPLLAVVCLGLSATRMACAALALLHARRRRDRPRDRAPHGRAPGSACACAPCSFFPSAACSPTPIPRARKTANQGVGQFAMAFAGPVANCATALHLAAAFLGAGGDVHLFAQPLITRPSSAAQHGLDAGRPWRAAPAAGLSARLRPAASAATSPASTAFAPAGRAAAGLGQVLALAAMLGGMLLHGSWLIIAGFFIMIGAQIEDQGVFFQSVVDTVRMREVMLTDFATLSPSDTLADALVRCVHSLQEDFPVVRGPQLVGIVSRQRIVDALRNDGNGYVQSVMSRAFQVARPEDTLGTTIRRLTAGHGLALIPVTESGTRGRHRQRAEPDELHVPAGRAAPHRAEDAE